MYYFKLLSRAFLKILVNKFSFGKITGKRLNYYNRSRSQVKYKISFTDCFGEFTEQLSLLWLADRIVNFQNRFVTRIFSEHTMSIWYWHGVHMTFRHISKSYRRHVSTAITVVTYNSPLCLGSDDFKFIFDSVVAVVAVTSYPFI